MYETGNGKSSYLNMILPGEASTGRNHFVFFLTPQFPILLNLQEAEIASPRWLVTNRNIKVVNERKNKYLLQYTTIFTTIGSLCARWLRFLQGRDREWGVRLWIVFGLLSYLYLGRVGTGWIIVVLLSLVSAYRDVIGSNPNIRKISLFKIC